MRQCRPRVLQLGYQLEGPGSEYQGTLAAGFGRLASPRTSLTFARFRGAE